MTNTTTTQATYTYPTRDFKIVGAFYVAYENSQKSGASGIAFFSPIAIANDSAADDDYRAAAYDAAQRRAMVKFTKMVGRVERACVFVASGDNDRQRFTLADADALARFVGLNDLRPVEGTIPRWFALARAGMVSDAVAAGTATMASAVVVD